MMHRNNLVVVGLGLAGAVLVALGCEIVVVNDFPAARGWGVGSGGEGTGGAPVTTSSTTTDVPTTSTSSTSTVVLNCADTCHGSDENSAPPVDTDGNTSMANPRVGAHQAHLRLADWHLVKGCTQCHSVPDSPACPNLEVHCDNEVNHVWGDVATAADAQPTFNWVEHTCTDVYCHGSTLASAEVDGITPIQVPQWAVAAGTEGEQVACGLGCHTNPPATEGHVPYEANVNNCQNCHDAVIIGYEPGEPGTEPDTTWRDKNLHINGIIEVNEDV